MSARDTDNLFATMQARLSRARAWWLTWRVALGVWRVLGLALLVLAALVLAELILRPEATTRALLVRAVALPLVLLALLIALRRATAGVSLAATARRVQALYPRLGGRIEGALDLARAQPTALALAALAQVARETRALSFARAVRAERPLRRLLPTLATLIACLAFATLYPRQVENAVARLMQPYANREIVGPVRIIKVIPGDTEVVEGSDVPVALTVDDPARVEDAVLELRHEDDGTLSVRRLTRLDEAAFGYTLRALRRRTEYRLRLGGSVSPWYRIAVAPRPAVSRVRGTVEPPAYTNREPFPFASTGGAIRAPVGSRVQLLVETNHEVVKAHAQLSTGGTVPLVFEDGALRGALEVRASGTYTLSLLDAKGHTNANPMPRPIEAVPDQRPRLALAKPGTHCKVGLGETVEILIDARDDYGLREARLLFKRNERGEPQPVREAWTFAATDVTTIRLPHAWTLDPASFRTGDIVGLWAEAVDHAPGTDRLGRSPALRLTVVDARLEARQELKRLEKLYRLLGKMLALQKKVHHGTIRLPVSEAGSMPLARKLLTAQAKVRTGVLEGAALLVEPETEADRRIHTVLKGLGANELPAALRALERAGRSIDEDERRAGAVAAIRPQAETIKRLAQILGVLDVRKQQAIDPEAPEKGDDLPPRLRETLQKLRAGLDGLTEQQKKVIEAGEALKKKNVDDFAEEDLETLAALKAGEEDWAKFLRDIGSDLSEVPKQDFSNPSLLGETVAILEEVEMVAESLAAKEVEIATEAASTGMELAESLTTHLEKWLSDKADHTAWNMEDPLADYQTPMAELPEKLEDIVGDLVEQEEELMQEAEDASSSWADSLDKGAGWDALDGPISNYSAQGVTGNQLPNDSEIGGRAGEGRQGKSHGEMVSDTAVGKGGRRTPSRLTPDAYEEGRIDDRSEDSGGGATGGGKQGNAGAEGLEGPPPPPDTGPMPRLAGKQAELRSRAERINIDLKLKGYNTALLENTIDELRSVEADMRAGRYRDAGRRARYAVDSLRTVQETVVAEAEVRADKAAGLPRELQREILDTLGDSAPEGYADLIKAYYEKLAGAE